MSTRCGGCGRPGMPCGCCEGVATSTPRSVANRPGLPALSYRAGTHQTFMQSMQAAISRDRGLDGLRTRAPDDPAIALLDAWATVADARGAVLFVDYFLAK